MPVTLAISAPQGVFTHPRSGFTTIQDFITAAKAQPGALNVGVPGIGQFAHLTSELLLRAAGNLRVTHVPYRGGGPLMQDLLAGTIDAGVVTFAAGVQQVNAGQLVGLAVTSANSPATFPDLPTAAQTVAPGFVQTTWMGLLAPKGTPDAAQARLHAATVAVLTRSRRDRASARTGLRSRRPRWGRLGDLFERTIATFANIATERGIVGES